MSLKTKKVSKLEIFLMLVLMPLTVSFFYFIYNSDRRYFYQILKEDQLVEWATFLFLILTFFLALCMFFIVKNTNKKHSYFFICFALLCLWSALEEISWGQRILSISSPEFFLTHSDQQEINMHNVVQKWFPFLKAKYIAGIVLFIYGVCLPMYFSFSMSGVKEKISNYIVVPTPALMLGFLIVSFLMLDKPTGREEEIGEFMGGLCFLLFIANEYRNFKRKD